MSDELPESSAENNSFGIKTGQVEASKLVDSQQKKQNTIEEILTQAATDGSLEEATKYQYVSIEEVLKSLGDI